VSPPHLPQLGSVVWAELEDANGYRKVRPAVVVTPSAEITAGKPVSVVAITTRLPTPCPTTTCCCPGRGKERRARG
jgi:mRNA-degrading endonuclease toxin of MazEF toxin-antitoxin module